MSDDDHVADFEAFRKRKADKEKPTTNAQMMSLLENPDMDEIESAPKLIYQDIYGFWQIVIQGQPIPRSQYDNMPARVKARLQATMGTRE